MTLLTICQNVADDIGVAQPSTIVSNTEDTAVRLLAAAKREGKYLARNRWSILRKEDTFSTVASTAEYEFDGTTLPSDVEYIIDDTLWDRTNYWPIFGSLSPMEWQYRKSGIIANNSTRKRYTIKKATTGNNKSLFLDPTPDAVETIAYEYISNEWCESAGGTGQSQWAADTDVARLDEYLIELGVKWRLLRVLGEDYAEERLEYDREVEKALARDVGSEPLSLSSPTDTVHVFNVTEQGFG